MREKGLPMLDFSQFIVNNKPFDTICGEIDSNIGSAIPQPVLIVGQEGYGKTTLLRRIISTYRQQQFRWIDGRSIFNSNDIIKQSSKATAIVIDNLDYYLDRCSYEEQYVLRRFLYNEGAPMLIASVSKLCPALTEYKAPFYEGLKKVYLAPLGFESLSVLFDDKTMERARVMFSLASPCIRSAEIIYDIINTNTEPDKDLDILLSYFSDKYRLMYQSVPPNSQHILNICGRNEHGLTMPEIREESKLASGILTPYLKNLCRRGFLTADKSVARNTKYSVRDPLFHIWLCTS